MPCMKHHGRGILARPLVAHMHLHAGNVDEL